MSKVLITGATGFIATHIIKILLERNYQVIGTVRTIEKGEEISKLFNNLNFKYSIVKNLGDSKQDFINTFKENPDIKIVIHAASGVFITDNIKEYIVDPAINGTQSLLDTIKEFGLNVNCFIFTSSIGAIVTPNLRNNSELIRNESTWNESTWEQSNFHPLIAYMYAKTQAERIVWNFAQNNENFKVVCINPSYVFGPQVFNEFVKQTLNSSNEVINTLLRDGDNYQKTTAHWVDVRDVAMAHIYGIEHENTKNKRLIMKEGAMNEQIILKILNENFPQLKGKISTPKNEEILNINEWDNKNKLINETTREILGLKQIDLQKTVIDTVQQILDNKVYDF